MEICPGCRDYDRDPVAPLKRPRTGSALLLAGILTRVGYPDPDRYWPCALQHLSVGFVSLTDALDLTTPAGRAMAALLAVFAEFEREVRGNGCAPVWSTRGRTARQLAGPSPLDSTRTTCESCIRAGISKAEIARRLQIGRTSVRRILDTRS